MNTDQNEGLMQQLKSKAEAAVKKGGDIRAEVSRLVSDAAGRFHQVKDGLVALMKAVTDGAVAGIHETVPHDSASVLRDVVNGLGDGLATAAQSVRLTLQESGASGVKFAKEDLEKISHDFREAGGHFGQIVSSAAHRIGGHVSGQAQALSGHAAQTLQSVWPSVESAISTAIHDPVKLGREAVHAGASAAQQAAGVLFTELGRHLQHAGDKLRH